MNINELENAAPDWDPENEGDIQSQNSGEVDDEVAREHYINVGKSKLLKNTEIQNDPKYDGRSVSRKDLAKSDSEKDDDDDELVFKSTSSRSADDGEEDDLDELSQPSPKNEDIEDNLDYESSNEFDDNQIDPNDSEFTGDEDDDDEDDDDELISTLLEQQIHEESIVKKLNNSVQADVEKGRHVVEQLSLWDGLLDMRIRIQKAVDNANVLPTAHYYQDLTSSTNLSTNLSGMPKVLDQAGQIDRHDNDLDKEKLPEELDNIVDESVLPKMDLLIKDASKQLRSLFDDLLDLRLNLIQPNQLSLSSDQLGSLKRKIEDSDIGEWITSTVSDVLEPLESGYQGYRNETIDKWNSKVQAANGIAQQQKLKVINQSVVSQIEAADKNMDKLIKRTQLNRSNYIIIGKVAKESDQNGEVLDKHLNDYDDQIFDDGDYYQQLLKELIDGRMTDSNDPVILAMRYAKLKQLQRKKSKKEVDTRASKGRKIRYEVQEKIQNFMAPEPRGTWHQEMIEELFCSLLSKRSNQIDFNPITDDGFKITL